LISLVESTCAIGIDVGGTKIAAGLINVSDGTVLARQMKLTGAVRGGEAVLADVIAIAQSLCDEAAKRELSVDSIGLGVAELVDCGGHVLSDATIRWKGLQIAERVHTATSLSARVDADVRVAALGESRLGEGREMRCFLYVTVGTGISSCLVIDGSPYAGARGLTGTFASSRGLIPGEDGELRNSPPLEQFASGPALAARLAAALPGFQGTAREVLSLAESGDAVAHKIAESAGLAVGASLAQLVNVLDPEAVIVGGGVGLAGGAYWRALEEGLRGHVWSEVHRGILLRQARLGQDAGMIGAALAAVDWLNNSG